MPSKVPLERCTGSAPFPHLQIIENAKIIEYLCHVTTNAASPIQHGSQRLGGRLTQPRPAFDLRLQPNAEMFYFVKIAAGHPIFKYEGIDIVKVGRHILFAIEVVIADIFDAV